jgi:hypothetical protein
MYIRTSSGLLVTLLLMIFAGNTSNAAENPLIGSWKWDNEKTLKNLPEPKGESSDLKASSAAKARKFVESVAAELRSNMVLVYTDRECDQITYDSNGHELSRKTLPYRIVRIAPEFVIVDQEKNGGVTKIYRQGRDSLYVEVQVGNYIYRDYFTRVSTTSKVTSDN